MPTYIETCFFFLFSNGRITKYFAIEPRSNTIFDGDDGCFIKCHPTSCSVTNDGRHATESEYFIIKVSTIIESWKIRKSEKLFRKGLQLHYYAYGTKEEFLRDFLVTLKQMLQNYQKILEEMFPCYLQQDYQIYSILIENGKYLNYKYKQ